MRQHIEPRDLEQLTKKGKERLEKWLEEKQYDGYTITSWGNVGSDRKVEKNLPTIGQMIEFLWEHNYQPADYEMLTFDDSTEFICDELWSACVEILNKE